ncbi:HipA domain-containing protein, partial [Cereibacter sphaeroides]|uniref:type II toxin-antitoxin system HipA family toxin n=1 Tax=Cereibacter sphaeroides TaxID=1063 RepID=UPI001F26D9E8
RCLTTVPRYSEAGVPGLVALGDLLAASRRIEAGEERDEDIEMLFAPGASLGGARPKCSVHDVHGQLSIAKFPKSEDDYSRERWEAITAELARRSGIDTAVTSLENVRGKPVMISRRFDRRGPPGAVQSRIPYASAMTMTQNSDGSPGSYLEILDAIVTHGSQPRKDRLELYRRIIFSVLVSNTDDHMRNHGFLRDGAAGWRLSPAFDINPTSQDDKMRVLTTHIDYDEGTCSMDLVLSVADEFDLSQKEAKSMAAEVARTVRTWRDVAWLFQAPEREITRIASAFEHEDLKTALRF